MELYELTIIFLLGIVVSMTLAYIFNQQVQGILNSFRTISAFDRRNDDTRRFTTDRRNNQRGVIDRRQFSRRSTDTF